MFLFLLLFYIHSYDYILIEDQLTPNYLIRYSEISVSICKFLIILYD